MQTIRVSLADIKDPVIMQRRIQELYNANMGMRQEIDQLQRALTNAVKTQGGAPPVVGNYLTPEQERLLRALAIGSTESIVPSQNVVIQSVNTFPPVNTATSGQLVYYIPDGQIYRYDGPSRSWVAIVSLTLPVVDSTQIVKGSVDSTKRMRFEIDGFTAGATRIMTPPDADTTLAGQNTANTFTAANTVSGANGKIDLANYALYLGGYKLQTFMVTLYNNAGTIQHAISSPYSSIASVMADKITGASTTLTNTPQLSNVVGFTNGAGISPSISNELVFNVAADQNTEQPILACHAVWCTAGAGRTVMPDYTNDNVNGVTRWRLGIAFFNAATGATTPIDTVNIPAGKQIRVLLSAFFT